MGDQEAFAEALDNLLARPHGAFVIFEHPDSGRFVQFAGSREEPLFLDLPAQTLSDDELDRARRLFSRHGLELASENGEVTDANHGFGFLLGSDVDTAATLARQIFSEVYQLSPTQPLLIVTEEEAGLDQ